MGWSFTHTEKGYQITSTVSDSLIHKKKYLTEDEVKSVMIEDALFDFFQKVIKIDKDFLNGYKVNEFRHMGEFNANKWMSDNWDKIPSEARNILSRLSIKVDDDI